MNKVKNCGLDFSRHNGLVCAVVQDFQTKEVLMQAFVDPCAWELILLTGEAWFWSTSRQELWRKGFTSGNTMRVIDIKIDCDRDAVLLLVMVNGDGVACHAGTRSCFC